jgi:hypothetical protein
MLNRRRCSRPLVAAAIGGCGGCWGPLCAVWGPGCQALWRRLATTETAVFLLAPAAVNNSENCVNAMYSRRRVWRWLLGRCAMQCGWNWRFRVLAYRCDDRGDKHLWKSPLWCSECLTLDPRVAGSNPTEAMDFKGDKITQHTFLRMGNKVGYPMS